MKATYNDFINQNPNCRKFENDLDMQRIFDLLSEDCSIIRMIDASEAGKPALGPFAVTVEDIFTDLSRIHVNSLNDNFTKQAVGLIIKTILEPFGYIPWKQKDLPKDKNATKFRSASTYRFNENAPISMEIVRQVQEIVPSTVRRQYHD
jgi:hypothetical protein